MSTVTGEETAFLQHFLLTYCQEAILIKESTAKFQEKTNNKNSSKRKTNNFVLFMLFGVEWPQVKGLALTSNYIPLKCM